MNKQSAFLILLCFCFLIFVESTIVSLIELTNQAAFMDSFDRIKFL